MKTRDDLQKRILGEMSARGDVTVDALAKKLRIRPHIVRYNLARLLERDLLQRTVFIDQRMLGFQTLCFLFDLPPESKKDAIEFLRNRPESIWFAHNSGANEFELSLCVRSTAQAMDLLTSLTEKTGAYICNQVTACEEDMIWWGVRAFADNPRLKKPIVFSGRERFDDDDLDRLILRAYRTSHKTTMRDIAQSVGVSQSTVQYRLRKLQTAGVISEEICFPLHTVPDMAQIQLYLTVRGRTRKLHERLIEFCQESQFVTALLSYVGDWHYKLVLCGESLDVLVRFEDRIKEAFAANLSSCRMCVRRELVGTNAGF